MVGKSFVRASLRNAILAALLVVSISSLVVAASDDVATPETKKQNRSKFEYNNGSAEEKRPYRRPNIDADPMNLRYEELRERFNELEDRVERLERQDRSSKMGQ
jgi:TolA-binding protein